MSYLERVLEFFVYTVYWICKLFLSLFDQERGSRNQKQETRAGSFHRVV
jgi:hypothetical protein